MNFVRIVMLKSLNWSPPPVDEPASTTCELWLVTEPLRLLAII